MRARATGSLLLLTVMILLRNSSTLVTLSRWRLLCWNTLSTHILRKLDPCLKRSASFIMPELMRMGKGYWLKRWGNLTMASACSPSLVDLSPFSSSVKAA